MSQGTTSVAPIGALPLLRAPSGATLPAATCEAVVSFESPCNKHTSNQVMDPKDLDLFLDYLDKVHQRTLRVLRHIPSDKLDWSYAEGKFTLGDLVRHMAAIERYMFGETIQGRQSRYQG